MEIKRNDILVEQYQANMTLHTFYKVLSVKGKTVQLYPLDKKNIETVGFMRYQVKPIDTKVIRQKNVITKRFNKENRISMSKYSMPLYKYNDTLVIVDDWAD